MWVAVGAPLKTQPVLKRFHVITLHYVLHHEAHLELYAQSVQNSNQVWVVLDPVTTKVACLKSIGLGSCLLSRFELLTTHGSRSSMKTMGVKAMVVSKVQREPERRGTAVSVRIASCNSW